LLLTDRFEADSVFFSIKIFSCKKTQNCVESVSRVSAPLPDQVGKVITGRGTGRQEGEAGSTAGWRRWG